MRSIAVPPLLLVARAELPHRPPASKPAPLQMFHPTALPRQPMEEDRTGAKHAPPSGIGGTRSPLRCRNSREKPATKGKAERSQLPRRKQREVPSARSRPSHVRHARRRSPHTVAVGQARARPVLSNPGIHDNGAVHAAVLPGQRQP